MCHNCIEEYGATKEYVVEKLNDEAEFERFKPFDGVIFTYPEAAYRLLSGIPLYKECPQAFRVTELIPF